MNPPKSATPRALQRWLVSVVVILALHTPFLLDWVQWMWGREHYQFFPLIVAGFAWQVFQRIPEIQWPSIPAFSVRVGLYSVSSLLLFGIAVKTNSHWVGLISCLVSLWTTVWFWGGLKAATAFRGPFYFLLLLVPLPLNLDLKSITELQKVATWLASGGLDIRGFRHAVSGVAIRTLSKGYMVEEACSGIHSLFSAVSAMVFLGVYRRYGLVRLLLLTVQTIFWVVVANAVRVFLIVYVDSRWQVALDSGWRHDALGISAYVSILLCSMSTDRFLLFLFPISNDAAEIVTNEFLSPVLRPLRKFFTSVLDKPALAGRSSLIAGTTIVLVCFLPLAGMAAVNAIQQRSAGATNEISGVPLAQIFNQTSFDSEWNGWTQAKFRNESRNPGDPFGVESAIWTFEGHGLTVNLSVDAWFPSWHDLTYCYQGIGWKTQSASNEVLGTTDRLTPHTQLSLYKNDPTYACVMFTCFDSTATAIDPPDVKGSFLRTLRDRLLTLGSMSDSDRVVKPPVFQVQLMVQSDRELQQDEVRLVQELLVYFRARIVSQLSPRM
jgi:exosortase